MAVAEAFEGPVSENDPQFAGPVMSMGEDKAYWFPAKRYGFGWGLPVRWEGWLILILWMASFFSGVREFRALGVLQHALFVGCMLVLLVWIFWLKGERPVRWRWGDRN